MERNDDFVFWFLVGIAAVQALGGILTGVLVRACPGRWGDFFHWSKWDFKR